MLAVAPIAARPALVPTDSRHLSSAVGKRSSGPRFRSDSFESLAARLKVMGLPRERPHKGALLPDTILPADLLQFLVRSKQVCESSCAPVYVRFCADALCICLLFVMFIFEDFKSRNSALRFCSRQIVCHALAQKVRCVACKRLSCVPYLSGEQPRGGSGSILSAPAPGLPRPLR